jgi:eukaryotic translation initiation factor 2C
VLTDVVNACTSAFFKPILVSEFLRDNVTFKDRRDRVAQLRGSRVHTTYEPIHSGMRSRAALASARYKSICGAGEAVSKQTFELQGRDGAPNIKTTVQAHFERSQYDTAAKISSTSS